jgi:hypothetical protein
MTLDLQAAEPATVALKMLRCDEALICRARGVNAQTVAEYAEAMKAGAVFPPVVVFRDPKDVHWLADGFHRCGAAELAGLTEIAADVREGGRREALLHAASANAAHGLRRTNADKRRAVELVLTSFPKWSDRKIGEACGVDHKSVAAVRKASGEIPQLREGADGKARSASFRDFNPERELARLEKTIGGVVGRWPGADADGRTALRSVLLRWSERVGDAGGDVLAKAIGRSEKSNAAAAAVTEG